jgi:DNA-binding MarR family transcriptional regulator
MSLGDRVEITAQRLRSQRPDLDLAGWELLARVARISFLANEAVSEALKPFGLTQHEYVVLASLRDMGPPYARSPSRLLDAALITTSGGLTNLLHRLERDGLVTRSPDPNDRRGVLVSLTDKGLNLVQEASTVYLATANQFLAGLSLEQVESYTSVLRDLLVAIEPVMLP